MTEFYGTTSPLGRTNCAKFASVTRSGGQFEAATKQQSRVRPRLHASRAPRHSMWETPDGTRTAPGTQRRRDTAETLSTEATPGTPGLPAPVPGCTKFPGSGTTNCLPGTHLPPPKAQLFHPAALVFLSSCAYVCTRAKVTLPYPLNSTSFRQDCGSTYSHYPPTSEWGVNHSRLKSQKKM